MTGRFENENAYEARKMSYFTRNATGLETVLRTDKLKAALSIMVKERFSQVPILRNNKAEYDIGNVEGVVTWTKINEKMLSGRLNLEDSVVEYKELVSREMCCREDDLIKDVAERVLKPDSEYVLILDAQDNVKGLATYYDVAGLYLNMVRPFSEIETIEHTIRSYLTSLSIEELRTCTENPKRQQKINSVHDLQFAEYGGLLKNYWERLNIKCDQGILRDVLEDVNEVRNRVMHFRPEGISEADTKTLDQAKRLLCI